MGEKDNQPLIGDLTGIGKIADSEIAKYVYSDAISPAMRQVGELSEDILKTLRLFTAPFQLAAAYQDRFQKFCERVREKVPEEYQSDAPPEIAVPVMKAFAYTRDESPLMEMFEELMAKAIDIREKDKLSPLFPGIISSLTPLQALLIADLTKKHQNTDDLFKKNVIIERVFSNFDFERYGGSSHHLTLMQDLKEKNLVIIEGNMVIDKEKEYPNLKIPDGLSLRRTNFKLSMFGRWFALACVDVSAALQQLQ